jgi:hypothetical protein
MLAYSDLVLIRKKGMRSGSWRRLDFIDKMFYKASICYARLQGKIVSSRVLAELGSIIEKLTSVSRKQLLRAGFEKARELIQKSKDNGILTWAPEIVEWVQDQKYIFWLGLNKLIEWSSP